LEQRGQNTEIASTGDTVTVDLRGAMRSFATRVSVLTTYLDEEPSPRHDGLMINSLTSASLDPPLVSVCLRHHSASPADLLKTKVWAAALRTVSATPPAHAPVRWSDRR
jgi:flavin reductase